MKCPKCYGKINQITKKCHSCGFNCTLLKEAENGLIKEYKKQGRHDEIVKTTIIPKDISRKKMLLYCGLLGIFGVHNYYVGKTAIAVVQNIFFGLFLIYCIFNKYLVNYFMITGPVLGGISILFYLFDFMAILLQWYKYPVVIKERV